MKLRRYAHTAQHTLSVHEGRKYVHLVASCVQILRSEIICWRVLAVESVRLSHESERSKGSTEGYTALGTSSPPYPSFIEELPISTTIPPVSSRNEKQHSTVPYHCNTSFALSIDVQAFRQTSPLRERDCCSFVFKKGIIAPFPGIAEILGILRTRGTQNGAVFWRPSAHLAFRSDIEMNQYNWQNDAEHDIGESLCEGS